MFETDPAYDVPTQTAPTFRYLVLYQEESGGDWLEKTLRAGGSFGLPGGYLEQDVREANTRRLDPSVPLPLEWTDAAVVQHLGLLERYRTPENGCFGLTISLANFARIVEAAPDTTWYLRFDAVLILRRADRVAGAIEGLFRRVSSPNRRRQGNLQSNENYLFPRVATSIGAQASVENTALRRLHRGGAPILEVCKEDLMERQQPTLEAIRGLLNPFAPAGSTLEAEVPVPRPREGVQRLMDEFRGRFLAYISGAQEYRPRLSPPTRSVVATSSGVEEIVERFGRCRSTADFYRMQIDLENLSTPDELLELRAVQARLPGPARQWIRELSTTMLGRDTVGQPFRRSSVAPGITLFSDQRGKEQDKTLLLVLCGKVPRPFMPTAIFLQALPAGKCDVALLSDRSAWFFDGMAGYAADLDGLAAGLRRDLRLDAYGSYSCAGISGASAGAVAVGLRIGARNAVSLGGRSPAELLGKKPVGLLDPDSISQSFSELARNAPSVKVRLVYSANNDPDRTGAQELQAIFGGDLVEIAGSSDHNIFFEQKRLGRLKSFLWDTLVL